MDLRLAGRTAVITGASRGIGAATARVLADERCNVHLVARASDALHALCASLNETRPGSAVAHPVDLRESVERAKLLETLDDVDIWVNNAGDIPAGRIDHFDVDSWNEAWALKVFGYIDLTRLVYARMAARGHGVIVNNIGASGERVQADYIAGSAGNAALMALTRALGSRSLARGVRVVGVNPGPVDTDRISALLGGIAQMRWGDAKRWREVLAGMPAGRVATPAEIADAIAFLASDRSGYTSGVIVTIDGGLCAQ